MRFASPLQRGILVRRYKRFLADVDLDGHVETVHCPNPGAMTGLDRPGSTVFVSRSPNPKRKLPLTLEIVEADGTLVGINTGHPNRLAEEAIAAGLIPALAGYQTRRAEIRYRENSRIDLLLSGPGREDCYVEVKNVHLRRAPGLMEFPDSVTKRGAKHLGELARQAEAGFRAVMLYIVQREDGSAFRLARDIDTVYGEAFDDALSRGVEALAYMCSVTTAGISVTAALPIAEQAAKSTAR